MVTFLDLSSFFPLKGELEDFHKEDFLLLSSTCTEICLKTLLPGHLDHDENFLATLRQRATNVSFDFS